MQQFHLPAADTEDAGNGLIAEIKDFSERSIKLLNHKNSIF